VRLLDGERFDDDACPAEKHIALAADFRPGLPLNDYGELQKGPGTDETTVGLVDEPGVGIGFGFPEQNGDKRGGVHQSEFLRPGPPAHSGNRFVTIGLSDRASWLH
jgi:hypothetical protein